MLTTSRMTGTGRGMTSPNRPPFATKLPTVSAVRMKWNGSLTISAGVKPAAK